MKAKTITSIALISLISISMSFAQHQVPLTENEAETYSGHFHTEHKEHKHLISFTPSYTFLTKNIASGSHESNKRGTYVIPSVGFDYFYKAGKKLELGLMTDIEMDHYMIENEEHGSIEREKAFIFIGAVTYKLGKHWNVIGGLGYEFERHQNQYLGRVGIERLIPMHNNWILKPVLMYDVKEHFDATTLGFTFAKEF